MADFFNVVYVRIIDGGYARIINGVYVKIINGINVRSVQMRLQKYMAMCGIDSRRKCEELISSGRVTVNGETAVLGAVVELTDDIKVDGRRVFPEEKPRYILYYKPMGEIATISDPQGRRTVMEAFKGIIAERIYPVGRLDYDTEGLLLLTNDGVFMQALTHPSNEVSKTYRARVRGIPDTGAIERLEKGVLLPDGRVTSPAKARLVLRGEISEVELTIHEGRNRQVRHMLAAVGHPVLSLRRVALYGLTLDGLKPGQWRELTADEVGRLSSIRTFYKKS